MVLAAQPAPAQQFGTRNIQSLGVSSFVIPAGSRAALRNFIENPSRRIVDVVTLPEGNK